MIHRSNCPSYVWYPPTTNRIEPEHVRPCPFCGKAPTIEDVNSKETAAEWEKFIEENPRALVPAPTPERRGLREFYHWLGIYCYCCGVGFSECATDAMSPIENKGIERRRTIVLSLWNGPEAQTGRLKGWSGKPSGGLNATYGYSPEWDDLEGKKRYAIYGRCKR